jgi:hypothetical protein
VCWVPYSVLSATSIWPFGSRYLIAPPELTRAGRKLDSVARAGSYDYLTMARAAPKIATRSALASPPGIVLHHGAQRLRDGPRLLRHWPCHGSLSQVPRGHTVFASSPSSITGLFWLDDSCSLFCRSRPRTMRGRRRPRSARWNVPTAARNGWCIFHLVVQGCSAVRAGGGSLQCRCSGWEGASVGVLDGQSSIKVLKIVCGKKSSWPSTMGECLLYSLNYETV